MADETITSTIASTLDWKDVAAQIFGVLKANVSGYLKDHAETQKLLTHWSEQIAKLMIRRVFHSAEDKVNDNELINLYKKAMRLELDAVIIDAEGLTHSTLTAVLDTIWDILLKLTPVLLKLVI